MFGILNLFKPAGPTSRDCVNQIQRLIRPIKVGHAGTLDPIAEGVLLIGVGQAARLVDWIHQLPKTYRGTFELGKTSLSADSETEISLLPDSNIPTLHDFESVLPDFHGKISQIPPIYSAIRIDGKRAYESARAGQAVEMPSREIIIHRLSIVEYEYPKLVIDIECSTGTYIRSLGRDMARRLGSDAIMTALHRTSIGELLSSQAVRMEQLDSRLAIEERLINPARCLSIFPQVSLDDHEILRLQQGKTIELPDLESSTGSSHPECVLALDRTGVLRSILYRNEFQHWRPHRNFQESTS